MIAPYLITFVASITKAGRYQTVLPLLGPPPGYLTHSNTIFYSDMKPANFEGPNYEDWTNVDLKHIGLTPHYYPRVEPFSSKRYGLVHQHLVNPNYPINDPIPKSIASQTPSKPYNVRSGISDNGDIYDPNSGFPDDNRKQNQWIYQSSSLHNGNNIIPFSSKSYGILQQYLINLNYPKIYPIPKYIESQIMSEPYNVRFGISDNRDIYYPNPGFPNDNQKQNQWIYQSSSLHKSDNIFPFSSKRYGLLQQHLVNPNYPIIVSIPKSIKSQIASKPYNVPSHISENGDIYNPNPRFPTDKREQKQKINQSSALHHQDQVTHFIHRFSAPTRNIHVHQYYDNVQDHHKDGSDNDIIYKVTSDGNSDGFNIIHRPDTDEPETQPEVPQIKLYPFKVRKFAPEEVKLRAKYQN